jgi:hypothetical protein
MKTPRLQKQPLDPRRIRHLPASGFSWIDRRLVREGFLEPLSAEAILLYFFLLAVSDAEGLSFYADPTVARILKLSIEDVVQARARLLDAQLILYAYPLYQVLPLPQAAKAPPPAASSLGARRGGPPLSLGEILKVAAQKCAEGAPQA